jgi:guanylate kinase
MESTNLHTAPHLAHRDAFEAALAQYHVSARAQKILDRTKLVLLTGPSSSGRNTIIDFMLGTKQYHFIISDTTRPPRVNDGVPEQNGREYWFRTEEDMLADIKNGEFLEAELIHGQQVSGISIRELEAALNEGKTAINEVDLGGIQTVVSAKPDTVAIFILPPNFEEWQRRMAGRGKMSPLEYKRRMETAARIFREAQESSYATIVVNDTVTQAAGEIDRIVGEGQINAAEQQQRRALAASLAKQTEALLQTL